MCDAFPHSLVDVVTWGGEGDDGGLYMEEVEATRIAAVELFATRDVLWAWF